MSLFRSVAAAAALTTALICTAAPAALAQNGGGGGGGGGEQRMNALFQGITLSSAEQTKVDSIKAAYRAKRGDMKMGPDMSDADRQAARDMMRQSVADYRSVLTPDHQQQFDANVANMRSQMRNRGGGGGGSPPPSS